ncbi:hypothetical protein A2926_04235 [Candidatus Giovannonibacteria bacterium RIFCSPLOWO2_01_FULL_44_40]|nr:MAG: hypothetical protein A2926_04235 [Candidatus Giovannonibacteria bacterium RIFCSPLOWO2_01_FULL_44_40]
MTKKLLKILLAVMFFSITGAAPALAAVNYSRSPSGASIAGPVTFNVSLDSFDDSGCVAPHNNFWEIIVYDYYGVAGGGSAISSYAPASTLSIKATIALPVGDIYSVEIGCSIDGVEKEQGVASGALLENSGGGIAVFKVAGLSLTPPFVATQSASTETGLQLTPIPIPNPIFNQDLDLGSVGDGVKILQALLAGWPEIYPEGFVTGYFGPLTQKAVERFQIKYGIVTQGDPISTGFGRVGPKTRAKLNEIINAR